MPGAARGAADRDGRRPSHGALRRRAARVGQDFGGWRRRCSAPPCARYRAHHHRDGSGARGRDRQPRSRSARLLDRPGARHTRRAARSRDGHPPLARWSIEYGTGRLQPASLDATMLPPPIAWWQTAAVYQVYPRSFADTDRRRDRRPSRHHGRLDHLAWLGVDAIWISPFYPSPMADFGYDVADYTDVDPALRHARRLRRAAGRSPRSGHPRARRLRAQPHQRSSTHGSSSRARAGRARSATGTSGATRSRMARRRTTGSACSRAPRGSGIRRRSSSTCTPSSRSSPT